MAAATSSTPPFVPLLPTPSNMPVTGGDSLTEDLNVYYEVSSWFSRHHETGLC